MLHQAAKEKEAEISHRGRYVLRVDATEALHPYDTSVSVAPELTSLSMEDVVQIPVLEDTTATIGCKLAGPCALSTAYLHAEDCATICVATFSEGPSCQCKLHFAAMTMLGSGTLPEQHPEALVYIHMPCLSADSKSWPECSLRCM